ncbi:MAG: hypothetical protein NTW21_43215 [Verrucomicrobia bacterium]|nr:hypothetical protein [Verrucomicrobiota bacterium]
MRAFKIWTQQKFGFRHNGELFEGEVFGGSNESLAEARSDAARRWEAVCQRITGALPRRSGDYEADIREEVLRAVGRSAVLTRNRYGAEVLNCPETVILDIDRPPKGFLDFFRRSGSVEQIRERIVLHTTACRIFAACRFESAVGDAPSSPVIALHDELSGALGTLPLA